jgi:glycosyltransferase involved in cell wall biosynthesis
MKFVCLHHRLGGYSSHHYNEARGLREELDRRQTKLVLLVNAHAEPRVVAELQARAVLDDPTFRLEWSFAERSGRFVDMLHAHVDRSVRRDDRLLVTIATQLEAHALTRWLQGLPDRRKPWIVVLFLSDRWNRGTREDHERQIGELGELRAALASLSADDARRMILAAVTERLAAELSDVLGTNVAYAPMPLPYGQPPPSTRPSSRPLVAILGGTRREKGSYRIADIIRATRALADVDFLVHLTNDTLTTDEAAQLARIADEPHVTVIREALPVAAYEAALASADLALFAYEVIPYRQRCSGVFGEAVAFGKPAIVTPGTWMAEQIANRRAAGAIADDETPESYARAIARCVANLDALRRDAESLSDAWRRTVSLTAFLDQIQAEIARRGADEPSRRRRFWPF